MLGRFSRSSAGLVPVLAATLLASCDTGSPTGPRIVTLAQVSGNEQAAPVGATLGAPLVIRAVDQNGVPIAGVALTWDIVSGGGAFVAASTSTDASGLGQAVFRLGNSLGTQRVVVSAGSQAEVEFTMVATAAPASQMRAASGNNQTGTVGAALPGILSVFVGDAVENPKAGVLVTFTITSGGGSLSTTSALSNDAGLASVSWTLGTAAGGQTVTATSPGLPAVTFTATATAAAPDNMTILSGNNQVASPGVTLPAPLRVLIRDEFGNGVPNVAVTWATNAGDGAVLPASTTTSTDGIAQGTWTLGPSGGLKVATASAAGFSVEFNAGSTVTYAAISPGGQHTCAVSTDFVLYCWGFNGDGQLGLGQAAAGSGPVYALPQPSAVTGALTFATVESGAYHTCALTLSSNPYCWGKNVDGRLGDGSTAQANAPTHLDGPHVFRQISAGATHSCGVTLADRLFCWGYALDGQVGIGPATDPVESPEEVLGNRRWTDLSAGSLHTCAVENTGDAYCWGVNRSGELGNGSTTDANQPIIVSGGHVFVRVAAGGEHSCGLTSGGTAYCWGSNTYGQLGSGVPTGSSTPVAVAGGLTFESISAGTHHTCGVLGTPPGPGASPVGGTVYCWGRNQGGQIGDNSQTGRFAPTATSGGLTFVQVAAGQLSTCGVTTGNIAYCWGDNQFGQLGDGTQTRRLAPTRVAFQP